jgi:hypothetical protein
LIQRRMLTYTLPDHQRDDYNGLYAFQAPYF